MKQHGHLVSSLLLFLAVAISGQVAMAQQDPLAGRRRCDLDLSLAYLECMVLEGPPWDVYDELVAALADQLTIPVSSDPSNPNPGEITFGNDLEGNWGATWPDSGPDAGGWYTWDPEQTSRISLVNSYDPDHGTGHWNNLHSLESSIIQMAGVLLHEVNHSRTNNFRARKKPDPNDPGLEFPTPADEKAWHDAEAASHRIEAGVLECLLAVADDCDITLDSDDIAEIQKRIDFLYQTAQQHEAASDAIPC